MTDALPTPESVARRPGRGLLGLAFATAASAALGWAALVVAARALGANGYAEFSVFWGLYFGLLGIVLGIQQETTRAVGTAITKKVRLPGHADVVPVAVGIGLVVSGLILLTSLLWGDHMLGPEWVAIALAVGVGVVTFAGQSAFAGTLTGTNHWNAYALLVAADAAARLVAVSVAAALGAGILGLVWGTVMGSLAWLLLLVPSTLRSGLRAQADVGTRAFLNRCAHAMAGSASTSILVTGFPVLLSLTTPEQLGVAEGVVLAAVTLTRAPLLVPLGIFQSVAIARFVARRGHVTAALVLPSSLVAALTATGTVLAAWLGPAVLRLLFGQEFQASGRFMAGLVVAAGVLAMLILTGSAVLASERHAAYSAGWLLAAAGTMVILTVDLPLTTRTTLALTLGPLLGVTVHMLVLWFMDLGAARATSP